MRASLNVTGIYSGRDPFVFSEKESSLEGRVSAQNTTGKLRHAHERISPPWRVRFWIKRSLGSHTCLPDVVFPSLRALIVSQMMYFMALPIPVAKQLRIQLCLWRERRAGEAGGARWPRGNGRTYYAFTNRRASAAVIPAKHML